MHLITIIRIRRSHFTCLKIALVQMQVGKDKAANIAMAIAKIHEAKQKGATLVALPECFNAPYGTQYFSEYAEEIPAGMTCVALSRVAKEAQVCVVGGSVPERSGDRLYNTCTVWDNNGELIAKHRKVHLFDIDIPGKITFKESDVLSPGNKITTFLYNDVRIGIGICYDIRFPIMAHVMSQLEDCSLLIYPGAFNLTTGALHWELLARARATDLQLWVALVSPARDNNADYKAWGHTLLVDPWGKVVETLDHQPGLIIADIDLSLVKAVREQIPIRQQKRSDLYDVVKK